MTNSVKRGEEIIMTIRKGENGMNNKNDRRNNVHRLMKSKIQSDEIKGWI